MVRGAHDEPADSRPTARRVAALSEAAPVHDLEGSDAVAPHQVEVSAVTCGHRDTVRASPIGQHQVGQRRGGQAVDGCRESRALRCTSGAARRRRRRTQS